MCLAILTTSNGNKLFAVILGTFLFISYGCKNIHNEDTIPNYNVLMICVDDLRPELGCYGNHSITQH